MEWSASGQVDVDIAGHFTSDRMAISLQGKAALALDPEQKTVSFDKVTIVSKDIEGQSGLIQILVMDKLAGLVAEQLNGMLLFSVPEESALGRMFSGQSVRYTIEPDRIIFSPAE